MQQSRLKTGIYLLPLSIELFTSNELLNLVCEVSETRYGEHNVNK